MKLNKLIVFLVLILSISCTMAWAEQSLSETSTITDMKTYEQLFPDPYFAKLIAHYANHDISDIAKKRI